jgi:hypothetical protein
MDSALFSERTHTLAQAITNPFSDAAIGAVIPDQWSPPSIPAMDRLSLDLNPAFFETLNPSQECVVTGVMIAFVPRSLGVGWMAERSISAGTSVSYRPIFNLIPVNSDFSNSTASAPIAEQYCLFVVFIGTTNLPDLQAPSPLAYDPTEASYTYGANLFPFSRVAAIGESCSGARICGAGLKVFSDEAPIETGGTAYGGWLPLEDLFSVLAIPISAAPVRDDKMCVDIEECHLPRLKLTRQPNVRYEHFRGVHARLTKPVVTPVSLARRKRRVRQTAEGIQVVNVQDSLRYRLVHRGVDGMTVRYSPLQSPKQEEFQPVYEDALFVNADTSDPELTLPFNLGVGVGIHDMISASDFVPAVVWQWNQSNVSELYNLRVEARVHLQAEPDGSCPFMTTTVEPDPNYEHLQIVLENKDAFPVATKGQSFRSFNHGLRELMSTFGKAVPLLRDAKSLF